MTHWSERLSLVPAVYVLLERDNKIFMLRRYNTGYANGDYTLPSGHMDGDEPPTITAVREAKEEAGVTIDPKDLEFVHCMAYVAPERSHERVNFFFRATKFIGEPQNAEPQKCDDAQWFSLDALPQNIVFELPPVLEHVRKGIVYSEFNYKKGDE